MAEVLRKKIDSVIEEQICTAAIVSTKFLQKTKPFFHTDYIHSSFAKQICRWCFDFFNKYEEAPRHHIEDIFKERSSEMSVADAKLTAIFLAKISENYVEDQGINDDYIFDNAKKYLRKNELLERASTIQRLVELDEIDKAEEQLETHSVYQKTTSDWVNPFDPDEVVEVFNEEEDGIFRYPGAIGELVGPLERGWFVAILGIFKRGKTRSLLETTVLALRQRLKTCVISLEMKHKNVKEIIYRRITAGGSKKEAKDFVFPCFDCKRNQDDSCKKTIRTNDIRLLSEKGKKPEFDYSNPYRPCTVCRGVSKDYKSGTWFEVLPVEQFTASETIKTLKAFEMMYGKNNLRAITYPRFSATIDDILRDLKRLEIEQDFIPDVIVVDYADILKPKYDSDDYHALDSIWKELAALAALKHCIVFTASQGNRGSIKKTKLDQTDLAEWIGKLGHVDVFLALNQTDEEKENMVLRMGVLAHRHREVREKENVMLLQQLGLGQFALDYQIVRTE